MALQFRNPELLQVLPYREWIRSNMPGPRAGFVVEDLDLVIRTYGNEFDTDGIGKIMLVELKRWPHNIGYAQRATFGLLHRLLRKADPDQNRYVGYFVVQYDNDDWDYSQFWVNGINLCLSELKDFLMFHLPDNIADFPG